MPVADVGRAGSIRSPKRGTQTIDPVVIITRATSRARWTIEEDCFWPMILFYIQQFLGGGIECFIPTNSNPPGIWIPFGTSALHRIFDSILCINKLRGRKCSFAARRRVCRMIQISFALDQDAVLHVSYCWTSRITKNTIGMKNTVAWRWYSI